MAPSQTNTMLSRTGLLCKSEPRGTVKLRNSCDSCQESKVKCSQEKPSCRRCTRSQTACIYSPLKRIGRPRKNRAPSITSADSESSQRSSKISQSRHSLTLQLAYSSPGSTKSEEDKSSSIMLEQMQTAIPSCETRRATTDRLFANIWNVQEKVNPHGIVGGKVNSDAYHKFNGSTLPLTPPEDHHVQALLNSMHLNAPKKDQIPKIDLYSSFELDQAHSPTDIFPRMSFSASLGDTSTALGTGFLPTNGGVASQEAKQGQNISSTSPEFATATSLDGFPTSYEDPVLDPCYMTGTFDYQTPSVLGRMSPNSASSPEDCINGCFAEISQQLFFLDMVMPSDSIPTTSTILLAERSVRILQPRLLACEECLCHRQSLLLLCMVIDRIVTILERKLTMLSITFSRLQKDVQRTQLPFTAYNKDLMTLWSSTLNENYGECKMTLTVGRVEMDDVLKSRFTNFVLQRRVKRFFITAEDLQFKINSYLADFICLAGKGIMKDVYTRITQLAAMLRLSI